MHFTLLKELLNQYISPCGFCIKVCPVGEDRKLVPAVEQPEIYNESNPEFTDYHKAWNHVRSYGRK